MNITEDNQVIATLTVHIKVEGGVYETEWIDEMFIDDAVEKKAVATG